MSARRILRSINVCVRCSFWCSYLRYVRQCNSYISVLSVPFLLLTNRPRGYNRGQAARKKKNLLVTGKVAGALSSFLREWALCLCSLPRRGSVIPITLSLSVLLLPLTPVSPLSPFTFTLLPFFLSSGLFVRVFLLLLSAQCGQGV